MKFNTTHAPTALMLELTGMQERAFYFRLASRPVDFIQPYRTDRFYSIKSWNKQNPDKNIDIKTAFDKLQ